MDPLKENISIKTEDLAQQDTPLTEEQIDALADEAYREMDAEEKGEEEVKEEEKEESDSEKADENKEEAPEKDTLDGGKEGKSTEKEGEEGKEGDNETKEEGAIDVKAYAEVEKISVEEAEAEIKSIKDIQAKYKDAKHGYDFELARANLHLQRLYTQTKQQLDTRPQHEPVQYLEDKVVVAMADGSVKEYPADQLIDSYREHNPKLSAQLNDEAVMELIKKEMSIAVDQSLKQQKEEMKVAAVQKRTDILNNLSESAKAFKDEIKESIDRIPDSALLKEGFDPQDVISYIKGKHYDEDIEKIRKQAFEEGQKEAKILGVKDTSSVNATSKSSSKGAQTYKELLTSDEQKRALDMFESVQVSDETKFQYYYDDFKKKKAS